MTQEEYIQAQLEKLMQHTKGHQQRGVHCDLWVQRLASSTFFKNKSTVFSCLQWKKYASFAKLLNGMMKQQIVAVVACTVV
jgi:hypothetical protein